MAASSLFTNDFFVVMLGQSKPEIIKYFNRHYRQNIGRDTIIDSQFHSRLPVELGKKGVFAVVIIFQPEIRSLIGKGSARLLS